MPLRLLENPAPGGDGMPLGQMVAADFKPGDPRRGIYTWEGEGHRLLVGPSGSGKFQAAIAPLLLTADAASVIVFDVADGEAARDTSRHRARLGTVVILDPFQLRSDGSGAINPLDLLQADDPALLSKAKRLADAILIFPKGDGNSAYWNGQAINLMVALLIHVATNPSEAGQRTLKRVREIIRRPFSPPPNGGDWANGDVFDAMSRSTIADGIVRDEAENVIAAEGTNNAFYVQSTLRENTSFLDMPEVQRVTATTTLNLRQLRERVGTLYVVVPEYELRSVGRWLRLIYSFAMEEMRAAVIGAERGAAVPLHVILDEFPTFGTFERVRDDMALVRRFGIKMTIAVQKLSQLRELYGTSWETFVPAVTHVLGADEHFTADYISKRLGTTTKPSTSESHDRRTVGGSQGASRSWISAPLMASHEIEQLPRDRCLVVIAGEQPRNLRKWALYDSAYLQERGKGGGSLAPPDPSTMRLGAFTQLGTVQC